MSILFMAPNWSVNSEAWLQRIRADLHPYVALYASRRPCPKKWQGTPVIPLSAGPEQRFYRLLQTATGRDLCGKLGLERVRYSLRSGRIDTVVCNYLDFAISYNQLWHNFAGRVLIYCHGYGIAFDHTDNQGKRVYDDTYVARANELAHHALLLANSEYTKQQLESAGIPGDRIIVKYLGAEAISEQRLNEKYAHEKAPPLRVLYLGRFIDFKGPDLVVRAFIRACESGFQGELVMAGDGSLCCCCELLARQSPYSDRISFLGAVEPAKVPALLRDADIFTMHNCRGVFTNREEAFGVTVIEAMAAGLPVVTGASGGVQESVVHDRTGYLVPPGDVDAHAQCLVKLQNEPALRSTMGMNAWRRALEHFSRTKEAREWRDLLQLK